MQYAFIRIRYIRRKKFNGQERKGDGKGAERRVDNMYLLE
jgi:hypothetical protein